MPEIDATLAAGLARRFRLVRMLGEGSMGAVFLAEQVAVGNRPVALKVFLRQLLDEPGFLARFRDEAAAIGRIRHPHVAAIYETGQGDDGTPYIAMEYLEGEPLRQTLQRCGPLPVADVAEILQQAASGLDAAHKLGILHRELKPDNIFLTYPDDESVAPASSPAQAVRASLVARASPPVPEHGQDGHATRFGRAAAPWKLQDSPRRPLVVKLLDFGIAKRRESASPPLIGRAPYRSYEQVCGMTSEELDARCDIYSLGVVVYEMLTGRVPSDSDSFLGYLRALETPPPFRAVNPHLPALPEVEKVVMKALAKDREQRYGSALDFAREFRQAARA
jgi:serine/threonine-protein kinase